MISNYILRSRIDSLKSKKDSLSTEKSNLVEAIKEFNISGQAAKKFRAGRLDPGHNRNLFFKREEFAKRILEVERELIAVNKELRTLHAEDESDKNLKLSEIFKEIFSSDQLAEIKKEAVSRMEGNEPNMLSFDFRNYKRFKDDFYKYRELSKDTLSKMIEFRILLTGLIEKGCDQFGNAEFLKFISPLNNLIIPLKELEKIRKDYHL